MKAKTHALILISSPSPTSFVCFFTNTKTCKSIGLLTPPKLCPEYSTLDTMNNI